MSIIEIDDLTRFIPSDAFNICKIDGLTRQEIRKKYTRSQVTLRKSCYYLDKFAFHIKSLEGIGIKEYCIKYLNIAWPVCPINGKDVGFKIMGRGLKISKFNATVTREYSRKFDDACNKMSRERTGDGNPMFGKKAWNKGLDISHPTIRLMTDKFRGKPLSEEHKSKLRQRRAENPLKARHTTPHSKKTKEKARINTARLWAEGVFNRTTSIHIKMREFLMTLPLKETVVEEFQVKYFSLDFAFPNTKVGIECQGSYYHIDPRLYPNGPINAMQRRNFGRDKAKRKFMKQNGWRIIECWETEINDGTFKKFITDKLKELNII